MKTENVVKAYELICNELVKKFAKKHGYEFSYWIGKEIGGIACFIEEYFFNMNDIYYDMKTNQPIGLIFEWQDYMVENQVEECRINFESYSKWARYLYFLQTAYLL